MMGWTGFIETATVRLPRARAGLRCLLSLAVLFAVVLAGCGHATDQNGPQPSAGARSVVATPSSGLPVVPVRELPAEARETLGAIDRGGPFPYRQDGQVFGNREHRLPTRPHSYYREYTVPTPGERHRGARRLVVGQDGDVYYTADHYGTFRQVAR